MTYEIIEVGYYGVNSTIIKVGETAYVVDPGFEGARILEAIKREKLTLKGVLLTHAHFDHVGAINELQSEYPELPIYVHEKDLVILNHPLNSAPPEYPKIKEPKNIVTISGASKFEDLPSMEVIETPGHTPGGVCYHFKDAALLCSGDTLFRCSIGRTDFPGGNMVEMLSSLKKLAALPDETTVIPGHGDTTTIGFEKQANPYLQTC